MDEKDVSRETHRRRPSLLAVGVMALILIGACASRVEEDEERTGTWAIDCVAVVGAPPATAFIPLDAVSVSGLPRDKYIGELNDAELGRLCDWGQCVGNNGYRYYLEQSRVEAPVIMSEIVWTARRTPKPFFPGSSRDTAWDSREDCAQLYRREYGACHVGPFEDCIREKAVRPLAYYQVPSCIAWERECGR